MGWRRPAPETPVLEQRTDVDVGIGDPALSEYLGLNTGSVAGVTVTRDAALGLSAVFRSVSLIAGTVGGLPLKSYRRVEQDGRTTRKDRVRTFLDDPDPDGATPFEWVELILTHLLLAGNAYLLHVYGGAGQLLGLKPINPSAVRIEPDADLVKIFKVTMADGKVREFTEADITHIPALGWDGLRGLSVISVARQSFGTAIAGDQAAARMFSNGLLLSGIMTTREPGGVSPEQADQIKAGFRARAQGVKHAGDVVFIPADVEFSPWSMSAEDAQFLESRAFGIEEVARWFGVPKELLSSSGGATSWGSGIQELVRGFARFTLASWTARVESRLSRLLPKGQFAEFDFSGLLQPSPEQEITLLIAQVQAGILSIDEARMIRNLEPLVPLAPSGPPVAEGEPTTTVAVSA